MKQNRYGFWMILIDCDFAWFWKAYSTLGMFQFVLWRFWLIPLEEPRWNMNASGMRSDTLCSCCSLRSEDAKWLLSYYFKHSKFQMIYVEKAGLVESPTLWSICSKRMWLVSTTHLIRSLEMEKPSFLHLDPPSNHKYIFIYTFYIYINSKSARDYTSNVFGHWVRAWNSMPQIGARTQHKKSLNRFLAGTRAE